MAAIEERASTSQMLAQQSGVTGIALDPHIEKITDQRNKANEPINPDVRAHPGQNWS
jgi:hypothetical protein